MPFEMTIEESIRRDLSHNGAKYGERKDKELDFQIVCSSKQVLMKQIEFKPAKTQMKYHMQLLREKYVLLNPQQNDAIHQKPAYDKDGIKKRERLPSHCESDDSESTIDIPKPTHVIYPASKIKLNWQVNRSIGCTLANQGNTCFMNSVLQCLTYTPPLYNYYQTGHHKQTCKRPGLCVMCTIDNHIHMVMKQPIHVITPVVLTSKFRSIQKQMETGRQHDVHEFLRVLLEEMHKSCLYGFGKDLDRLTEETSAVYQVFGGKIRNRICCTNCKYRSDTFETFLDLPLDLKSKSIEQCLRIMIKPEMLFGDNKYKCSGCRKLVDARKTFRIVKPPNVLTVVLKRYDASGRNIKNRRFVEYPEYFDLRPFMAGAKKPVKYKLYGVLPHEGNGSGYGHYFTFVRAPNNLWYKINDHASDRAGRHHVMNAEAYLLFYVRTVDTDLFTENGRIQAPSQKLNGRVEPASPNCNHSYANGKTKFSPLPQKVTSIKRDENKPNISKIVSTPSPTPSSLPPDRPKLSFSINRKGVQGNNISQKPNVANKTSNTGNTLSRSTAESFVRPKNHTESRSKPSTLVKVLPLVPYGSDSSDSEDYDTIAEKISEKSFEKAKSKTTPTSPDKVKTSPDKEKTSPLSNHRNLMAVRSTESPLRLAITTNCNASKMMSTGLWKVSSDTDQQTPSVASDASNTSASSTSEWNVQEKKMLTPLPKESSCEAEFLGWTVSAKPSSNSKTSTSNSTESSSKLADGTKYCFKEELSTTNGGKILSPPPSPVQTNKFNASSNKWKIPKHESSKNTDKYSNGYQNGHTSSNGATHENQKINTSTSNNLKRDFSNNSQIKNDLDDRSVPKKSKIENSSRKQDVAKSENGSPNSEKDNIADEEKTKTFSSAAPTQSWDHHVKDGYQRKANKYTSNKSSWDGRDNSGNQKDVNKILTNTSMRSYGSSVKSWEDEPSELDKEAKRSWRQEKKSKRDSYEEELDQGKVKKVKSNDYRERHHHGYNAFQRHQNYRNTSPQQKQGYNRFHPYKQHHGWYSNKTWRR
ncbi:uncharacterized protein [Antedon mediterranea]|uniref:uncharacterized protein n=1 Tax=Antedon mediterranea TaxID=105859 RepID=UPI003AF5275F